MSLLFIVNYLNFKSFIKPGYLMEKTLCIIKPDSVRKKYSGKIIDMILNAGFNIQAMKMLKLSRAQAEEFYDIHKGKSFFEDLVRYMTSGSVIVVALEKDNAINDYRKLIGATDPAKAEAGTVRNLFGESLTFNAVHGSDSVENGLREVHFFFSEIDLI